MLHLYIHNFPTATVVCWENTLGKTQNDKAHIYKKKMCDSSRSFQLYIILHTYIYLSVKTIKHTYAAKLYSRLQLIKPATWNKFILHKHIVHGQNDIIFAWYLPFLTVCGGYMYVRFLYCYFTKFVHKFIYIALY